MLECQAEQKSSAQFFSKHSSAIILTATLCFVVVFSFSTLVTKPRLWIDEAVSINIAQSFLTSGILSIQTAPDTFFQFPQLIQSTGYPVTVALAGFFKVFGYGIYQARIFMVLWIILALSLVFFLARKLFGKGQAYFSLLLIASFASFYGSGRTVVGEIPGFAFLLAGFYTLLERKQYFLTGIFWGLAVVSKPSVFGLIIPTIVLTFLFEREGLLNFFKKTISLGLGMIPAGLLWILLVVSHPFTRETWTSIGAFYKNPYSSSITDNVARNLLGFFHSTTLIYFGLLSVLVLGARFLLKDAKLATLYTFTLIYSLLAFLYYLRSPGWLRYILIAELLILFILPHVVHAVASWLKEKYTTLPATPNLLANLFLGFLVLVQVAQMFTVAQIFFGDNDLRVASYLQKNFPDKTIGLLNATTVAILLKPSQVFLTIYLTGLPVVGENPLLLKNPPEVIVSSPGNRFINDGKKVLDNQYAPSETVGGYSVYIRK